MSLVIVDYQTGNIRSIIRILDDLDYEYKLSSNPRDIENASKIILPGVGSFYQGIENLKKHKLIECIRNEGLNGKPLLGICLGMQLLASVSYENGNHSGLDLIKGEIKLLKNSSEATVPHMGWNEVEIIQNNVLFNDIENHSAFYFCHSYHFVCENPDNIVTTTEHGTQFVSSVAYKNIYGVQFHPEKSHKVGQKLIENFVRL